VNVNTVLIGVGGIGLLYTLLKRDLGAPVKAVVDAGVTGGKWLGETTLEGLGIRSSEAEKVAKTRLWESLKSLWGYSPTKDQVKDNIEVEGFKDLKNPKTLYENAISQWKSPAKSGANLPNISEEWN